VLVAGIDPGTLKSAYTVIDRDTKEIKDFQFLPNEELLEYVWNAEVDIVVIEMIYSYGGMSAGETTLTTCHWSGRYWVCAQYSGKRVFGIGRKQTLKQVCGNSNARDKGVRQELITRYGYHKGNRGLGTKASPGPLYGLNEHCRSALAVALAYIEGPASIRWDSEYSISEEKKARDRKKADDKLRKSQRAAAKGSPLLAGKSKKFATLRRKGKR
jgi:Holliday junction resolvasome RuvABC endonuclease subunit